MPILGIDYGLKKVGFAIGAGTIADPHSVVRFKDLPSLIEKVKDIISKEGVGKVVVGISEGEIAEKTQEFVGYLKKEIKVPVEVFDETLSTYDAQKLAINANLRRKKRKEMEDAYSAAVMLQSYLERPVQ